MPFCLLHNYAKRNAHRPVEKRKGNRKLHYIHVQDIEDYHDGNQREKFYKLIDEMRTAENLFGISYELGYSNYTFELWMLLHVADITHSVHNRYAYLPLINKWFHRSYTSIDEFKRQDEFQRILNEYVTLDSIKQAIRRAKKIVQNNYDNGKHRETHAGFTFFATTLILLYMR